MSAERRRTAHSIIRARGNIGGWERAMWREQERQEIEDRIEAFRASSRAALTSDPDSWQKHPRPAVDGRIEGECMPRTCWDLVV